MLNIDLSKQAADFLKTRPPKHQRQLAAKLQSLRENPEPADSKMLKGVHHQYRRTDAGEYRVVYRVAYDCLVVHIIGKRNDDDVYRRLANK